MSTELKEKEQEKPKYKNINSEYYIGFEIFKGCIELEYIDISK